MKWLTWLTEQLISGGARRRQFEVWAAAVNGSSGAPPLVMVAGSLTRHQAVRLAEQHLTSWSPARVLVLDGRGDPVYRG